MSVLKKVSNFASYSGDRGRKIVNSRPALAKKTLSQKQN
jgi:hypothetical protein